MEWGDLENLVDLWHEAASAIPDYQHTTPDGDGIRLILLANRSKDGDLVLTAVSVKDFIATISPSDLRQPVDVLLGDYLTAPHSRITVRREGQ